MAAPEIAVVVTTYEQPWHLQRVLSSLALQTVADPADAGRLAIGGVGMGFGLIGLVLLMVATIGVAVYITRRVLWVFWVAFSVLTGFGAS